jgi:hypothetical protein
MCVMATDFRHKFGALHQSYTPNKDRELYSMYLAFIRVSYDFDVPQSPSDGGHGYATNSYDYTKWYVWKAKPHHSLTDNVDQFGTS